MHLGLQRVKNTQINRPPVLLSHSGTGYEIQSKGLVWEEFRVRVIMGLNDSDGSPVVCDSRRWQQPIPPERFTKAGAPHARIYRERDGVPCVSLGQMRITDEKDKEFPTPGLLRQLTNRSLLSMLTPEEKIRKRERLKELETLLLDWAPKDKKLAKDYAEWVRANSVSRPHVDVETRIWRHWCTGGNKREWVKPDAFTGKNEPALTTAHDEREEAETYVAEIDKLRADVEELRAEKSVEAEFRAVAQDNAHELEGLRAKMAAIDKAQSIGDVRKVISP